MFSLRYLPTASTWTDLSSLALKPVFSLSERDTYLKHTGGQIWGVGVNVAFSMCMGYMNNEQEA